MATEKNQTDVATVSGEVVTRTDLEHFHERMRTRATLISSDRSAEIMERQAMAVLLASGTGDADAIMRADMGGTVQAKDAPSLEIEIREVEPVISANENIEGGHGYYISMAATVLGGDDDMLTRNSLVIGGDVVLQTGAELFVLKVAALEKAGALPYRGRVTSIPTRSGNTVVKFTPLPRRTA
jgi:hypothetical protein